MTTVVALAVLLMLTFLAAAATSSGGSEKRRSFRARGDGGPLRTSQMGSGAEVQASHEECPLLAAPADNHKHACTPMPQTSVSILLVDANSTRQMWCARMYTRGYALAQRPGPFL